MGEIGKIPPKIQITKYKNTRFYAIWLNQELLAVVCYKKGALAIKQTILKALNTGTEMIEP